jgi:hypothetical protein
MDVGGESR